MAKLIIIVLAFSALVAFASAHRPIVTTTTTLIEEVYSKQQCSQQLQGQRFNQCQSYISSSRRTQNRQCCTAPPLSICWDCMINMEGEQVTLGQGLEQCCNELKIRVEEECQCEAIQEVYKQAQEEQQWSRQQQTSQDLQQTVLNLINHCNLQIKQCKIPAAMF